MAEVRLSVHEADGKLPAVCMCCGQPATTTVTRKMQWHPGWVYIFLVFGLAGLLGLLIYAVVANIMTRRVVVQVPLCDDHKGHWFKRAMLMWGSFFLFGVAGVAALVFAGSLEKQLSDQVMPFACGLSGLGLLAWLVIVIVCKITEIRPNEITDSEVLLKGVSEKFVEAVAEADREREERRAARRRERERPGRWRDEADDDDDDDDDDARPRKKRPSSDDRIEE
jgi:hypothetical protein